MDVLGRPTRVARSFFFSTFPLLARAGMILSAAANGTRMFTSAQRAKRARLPIRTPVAAETSAIARARDVRM